MAETPPGGDVSGDLLGRGSPAVDDAAALFRALGDPARLTILDELRQTDGICACDFHCCGLTQPTISHHLRVLRDSGLVRTEKCGLWVRYSLNADRLAQLQHFLADHLLAAGQVETRAGARLLCPCSAAG